MTTITRKKIVANELSQVFSNKQVQVTWTETMQNGSLLIADGTEAAIAAIADVVYIINDFDLGDNGSQEPEVGDVVQANCITFATKVYADQLAFTDFTAVTVANQAALVGLSAKQIELV